jgi:hypothetical protein
VIGNRQHRVTEPTRLSLAQFSKSLTSRETQAQPDCDSDTTERFGLESVGQKQFAAEVVAAMSNPALGTGEEVVGQPKRQFAIAKIDVG